MLKKAIFSMGLVFALSSIGVLASNDETRKLEESGYVNVIQHTEERISEELVSTIEQKGLPVEADVVISENGVSGNIRVDSQEGKTTYRLSSKEEFEENGYTGYRGDVNKGELKFELFLLEGDEASINIFETDDENNRINPFTIHLDGSSVSGKKREVIKDELNPMFQISSKSNFDTLIGLSKKGLKLEVQGYKNRTESTPWITRLWTKESDAIDLAEQSENEITRVGIYRAFSEGDAPAYSTFNSIKPADDSDETMTIPFTIKGEDFEIDVKTSDTDVTEPGYSNPQSVEYYWWLKGARNYEEGNNDEGILTQQDYIFNSDTPRNSYGYIEVDVNTWLNYEIVGNYREYVIVDGNVTVWYD
ncbi:hypothetical protein [Desertibacillus haloalkaliphilus]|uniref:hypothetical protein n=1 Tax=Desertibacillus haloalkaliphilus TaxID=1328930 RepID=UPI001C26D3A6|nr:hypothetical protein [Desertibacillus haloalkaliphilus]MBU8908142.1 hypothetical protein [Desertibacillus haloalkaliphilus]